MRDKKMVIIAPDGGWGYLVALGFTLVLGTSMVPLQACFSIIFGSFLSEIGDGPSLIATITSVFAMLSTFIGVLANPLIQKYSLRKISFFGAILFLIGSILNIFVTKAWHLLVTYSVLSGMGFGIILPCVLTSFNSYFDKRRAFMNGLAQLGLCPLYVALPVCFQYFMEHYGFRGTVAILAAFSANMFISVAVLSPVEKHARREYELVAVSVNETIEINENLKKDENLKLNGDTNNSNVEEISKNETGIWQQIIQMLDLTLLHEWKFINLITGIAIFFYLDLNFMTLSPMFLIRRAFDANQVALCVTAAGLGDFFGRFTLTIISRYIRFKFWYIFYIANIVMCLLRNVFLIDMSYVAMLALYFTIGFIRSYVHTPIPLLFTERYNIERFPAAWGLYSVACGFSNILLGTFISTVADYFKNDVYTMHTFTIIAIIFIITWLIQAYLECRSK